MKTNTLLIRLSDEDVKNLEFLVRSASSLVSRAEIIRQLIASAAQSQQERDAK